ncbi:MAG: hypothetical protein CBC55_09105 [Gammaproteobacteria bacterium TMED95]|nr:MAG: hypothetical protein CBC55_09105 [Gammaproteobacteria bacterium TMED95]
MALNFPIERDEKYEGRISFTALNSSTGAQRFASGTGSLSAAEGRGGQRGVANSKTITTTGGSVNLYLPQGLNFQDGVQYENTDLGVIGSAISGAAGAVYRDPSVKGIQAVTNAASSVADQVTSNLFGAQNREAAAGLAERFVPGGSNAIAMGTGITANPHRRSIFRDVALRQFSFNFTMVPASPDESAASEEIVKFFRVNLYPERAGPAGTLYKFPTKFDIGLTYKGEEVATKILPCYLTSVQTQYNPRSGSFHTDSKFNEISIALSFQEETTLDKQMIEDGF